MADETLSQSPWYHGLLPREDIKHFLRENGDFLVRMSEPADVGKREFIVSVMFDKDHEQIKHFVVNKDENEKFYIEKNRFDSVSALIKYFLDSKTSVSARNCLYGDGKVKISDFGLSRIGSMYQMNPKCKVPVRWLAPETLKIAMYTQKSDVWSYGILCWEFFHNGAEPYPGMTVMEMNVRVKAGYRMALSDLGLSPETEHLIVKRCWSEDPNNRFTMGDIARALAKITKLERPIMETSRDGGRQSSKVCKRKAHK